MKNQGDGYLSIIGDRFLFPIATVFEKLSEIKTYHENEVQTSATENGYSTAAIVLSAIMVESYIIRAVIIMIDRSKLSPESKPRERIKYILSDTDVMNKRDEIFTVRDVIVHNHPWGARVFTEGNELKFASPPEDPRVYSFGDKKYGEIVDFENKTTKFTGINVFPTKINKLDAVKIFKNAYDILKFMENRDRALCYVSHLNITFNNERLQLDQFVSSLDTLIIPK